MSEISLGKLISGTVWVGWLDARSIVPPLYDDDRSDDVLVAFEDGTCAVLFFDYDSYLWRDAYGSECSGLSEPTHWMPLPDSPVKEIVG